MAGPVNPAAAPEGARGGQYVTVPGFGLPGQSMPSHSRTADGSTVVYSPKGWRWEEAGDSYSLATAKVAAAAMEGAVRRVRSSMGEVFYIKGTPDTNPEFSGGATGDTCRVQDAITGEIVAEWRWTGSTWERMRVSNEQISNLDVGKLTAGSAAIAELTARKIASDVGRFLELTTDQLTVTGNASFVNATAHHIWTRIINATEGEFEQIRAGMLSANSVNASNLQAGAIDGQVITGATLQSTRESSRGLKITSDGIFAYSPAGKRTVWIDSHNGYVDIDGNIGISDTWSRAWFGDITDGVTGIDSGKLGDQWGVGIFMNKLNGPYKWPALVTFKEDPSVKGGMLYFQAPSHDDNGAASMRLSRGGWNAYGGKDNVWGFGLNGGGFTIGARGVVNLNATSTQASIWMNLKNPLGIESTMMRLTVLDNQARGVYCNGRATVMAWDSQHQIYVDSAGVHQVGNKAFAMRVPGEWQKRHKMLEHFSTESPYDGIEYWETIDLDAEGRATWTLPDYVPKIASVRAPWIVLTSDGASAVLNRTGYGTDAKPWTVSVTGRPNTSVAVLVKGARQIDVWDPDTDEVALDDRARTSLWTDPPGGPGDGPGTPPPPGYLYDGEGPFPKPANDA
uniref:Uncharacterized protein n=1 Tax=Dulem virus 38 TaxID=3145756 RepID=A0AAU8B0K4_9CAUD